MCRSDISQSQPLPDLSELAPRRRCSEPSRAGKADRLTGSPPSAPEHVREVFLRPGSVILPAEVAVRAGIKPPGTAACCHLLRTGASVHVATTHKRTDELEWPKFYMDLAAAVPAAP